jgi:hypothetical protein
MALYFLGVAGGGGTLLGTPLKNYWGVKNMLFGIWGHENSSY